MIWYRNVGISIDHIVPIALQRNIKWSLLRNAWDGSDIFLTNQGLEPARDDLVVELAHPCFSGLAIGTLRKAQERLVAVNKRNAVVALIDCTLDDVLQGQVNPLVGVLNEWSWRRTISLHIFNSDHLFTNFLQLFNQCAVFTIRPWSITPLHCYLFIKYVAHLCGQLFILIIDFGPLKSRPALLRPVRLKLLNEKHVLAFSVHTVIHPDMRNDVWI